MLQSSDETTANAIYVYNIEMQKNIEKSCELKKFCNLFEIGNNFSIRFLIFHNISTFIIIMTGNTRTCILYIN